METNIEQIRRHIKNIGWKLVVEDSEYPELYDVYDNNNKHTNYFLSEKLLINRNGTTLFLDDKLSIGSNEHMVVMDNDIMSWSINWHRQEQKGE